MMDSTAPPTARQEMARVIAFYVVAGALMGATLWLLAPVWEGQREPWDGPHYLYRGGFLLSGLIIGALRPAAFRFAVPAAWLGAWAGQVPFVIGSQFQSLGLLDTGIGSGFFAGAVFIAILFRRRRVIPPSEG